MTREICGSFETKEEAIKVVNALSLKGFPADRIKVFTSQTNPVELAREMDGFIVHVQDDADKKSTTTRFEKLFAKISDCDADVHQQLRSDGLSERQAENYGEDIKNGNIVVLADNNLKMGHYHSNEMNVEFGMESPLVHHDTFRE